MGISVGLVGLGQFGKAFADMFMNHPAVDRIALCDREPDRMTEFAEKPLWQKKLSANDLYSSHDEICKAGLDALVIITQPWLHAPQAIQAMESGASIYSAVPIISLPDGDEILDCCDRIIETCKRTGKRYMLGETSYYRPQTMFCRKKAAEGMFGNFVYAEGEYFHDVDSACNLREVQELRTSSASGKEGLEILQGYADRGIRGGPMHYPTHSTCGPVCVMQAHALKVTGYGYANRNQDPFFANDAFSDEMAFFEMSNGAKVRICEFRECAGKIGKEDETFRIIGTRGSFSENTWYCNFRENEPVSSDDFERLHLSKQDMRDPLPAEVTEAFKEATQHCDDNGDFVPTGHGGSHPYLVHEFVDAVANDRQPAVNAWEAARYMAMGVMAHKSALRDGERLDVPDWGDAPES